MARRPKKSEEVKADADPVDQAPDVSLSGESEDVSSNLPESGDQPSQCGGVLSTTRDEQGFSTKDVAKQLRLSTTQIEALEQDDFASLPEATIVKGFIRNYAKLLKIPAEPLLNAYSQMVPAKEHYSFALKPGINMKITENGESHKLRYFLIVTSVLLGIGIWFFYQNYIQKPSPINPMSEITEALPELALPRSERVEGTSITQLEMPEQAFVGNKESKQAFAKSTTEKPSEIEPVKLKETDNAEVEVTSERVVEPEVAEAVVAESEVVEPKVLENDAPQALGKTRLEFAATQETWLSVVNTSGREVYNKILYAGDREVVDVRQPSEIVVGNAHGATLIVDGKPIDLAPYIRINVARVRMNRLP